jgi:hypothetical protein
MADPPPMTELYVYGTFFRPEDDWCISCAKPSLMEAPANHLTVHGMTLWGKVTHCLECKKSIWISFAGVVLDHHEV